MVIKPTRVNSNTPHKAMAPRVDTAKNKHTRHTHRLFNVHG